MKRKLTTVFILLILWQMASWMIQKEVILPFPGDVLMRMGSYLFNKSFYIAIFYTMIRILFRHIQWSLFILSSLFTTNNDFTSDYSTNWLYAYITGVG